MKNNVNMKFIIKLPNVWYINCVHLLTGVMREEMV